MNDCESCLAPRVPRTCSLAAWHGDDKSQIADASNRGAEDKLTKTMKLLYRKVAADRPQIRAFGTAACSLAGHGVGKWY